MTSPLASLSPSSLWAYFYQICQIPHPSKHEKQLAHFIIEEGKRLQLDVQIDTVGNILIKKPAYKGYDTLKTVTLQAHIDMVPQKNSDIPHDFTKDPIQPYIDGQWVTATDTTLGADNGIGVATMLALLADKDIPHGPIEALFTIDEETGMTGAFDLKKDWLKGDILINLDTEDEGELCVGCAGGLNASITIDFTTEPAAVDSLSYTIALTGLKGGHSGMDISTGRGNANLLMIRLLSLLSKSMAIQVSSLQGGSLRNAIPREAFAQVVIPTHEKTAFEKAIHSYENLLKDELVQSEPSLRLTISPTSLPDVVWSKESQQTILASIYSCPNGVIRYSDTMPGVVETSTNLAIIHTKENQLHIQCLLRSFIDSAKEDVAHKMEALFTLAKANIQFDGSYPGWKPNLNSSILAIAHQLSLRQFGDKTRVQAVHAGLECGIIGAIYPHMEMISFGPTIRFPHSPDEKVEIASVHKFWDYLLLLLKNIPRK